MIYIAPGQQRLHRESQKTTRKIKEKKLNKNTKPHCSALAVLATKA